MRRALALLLMVMVSGCLAADPGPGPMPDKVSLWGTIFLEADRFPGVLVTLSSLGGTATQVTDAEGAFRFDGLERGPCELLVETPEGDEETIETQCPRELTIRIAGPLTPTSRPVAGPRTPLG